MTGLVQECLARDETEMRKSTHSIFLILQSKKYQLMGLVMVIEAKKIPEIRQKLHHLTDESWGLFKRSDQMSIYLLCSSILKPFKVSWKWVTPHCITSCGCAKFWPFLYFSIGLFDCRFHILLVKTVYFIMHFSFSPLFYRTLSWLLC